MKCGIGLANDPESDNEPDPQAIAALIERLQAAGHHIHQDRSGGYLVTKWGMTRHCIDAESLQAFAKQQEPDLKKIIAWAAETQVAHWMSVIADWKKLLGDQWDKTYAASNTIYVARQNNVLFSVLAQFFPPEAINDRLLLIETISFTITPADMLDSLTRIIADRSVGALFFGSYHLMDYELMGGNARKAITAETARYGMRASLPPAVPFGSHQWPTLIAPGAGAASLDDLP
jgi:hypothetical protein